ncbi:MAG: hypothetical protein LBT35_03080 [Tannerella sp.]|jgi:hypothetical protein|nr:hypothetical protein [Tannerella sp.]
MIFGIMNIFFGVLVWSPSFVSPDKRTKFANALSWAGIILLIWGLMGTGSSLAGIEYFGIAPLYWILWLSGGVISLLLGVILGINLLKRSSGGIVEKILPYQKIIGSAAITVGILQLFVQSPL